ARRPAGHPAADDGAGRWPPARPAPPPPGGGGGGPARPHARAPVPAPPPPARSANGNGSGPRPSGASGEGKGGDEDWWTEQVPPADGSQRGQAEGPRLRLDPGAFARSLNLAVPAGRQVPGGVERGRVDH